MIPTADEVRAELEKLSNSQLIQLSKLSDTPYGTLMKIQRGETKNPRIATVSKIWPLLRMMQN